MLPHIADQYGNKQWNDTIRALKSQSESYSGGTMSLYENLTWLLKESKNTLDNAQKAIETKTIQVKETAESVQKALDAVEKAKTDLEKLSTFGSGKTDTGITQ